MPSGEAIRGLEDCRRAALLISECQSALIDPAIAMFNGLAQQVAARCVIPRIARLAQRCRMSGIPVIHATVRLLPGARGFVCASSLQGEMRRNPLLCRNRDESRIHPELTPQPGDLIAQRMQGITAFHGTELEAMLRGLAVSSIVLVGVSTDLALAGTAIEAVNRGLSVVLPEDCTAGASAETHLHAVRHLFPLLASVTRSELLPW